MIFKKVDDGYYIRLEKGEEVIQSLKNFCYKNNIKSGFISGIGGASEISIEYFDLEKKKYFSKNYSGRNFEILSLSGNISTAEGYPVIHIHGIFGDRDFSTFGGHLEKAIIGVTAEILVHCTLSVIGRKLDEEFGLNFWHF